MNQKMKNECNLKQLLEFKNQTDTSVDLYIYGDIISHAYIDWNGDEIETDDTYPTEIRQFLDEANGRDVNIYINSGGGSVFAGMAIASMIQRYEGKTSAYIDGICASIATMIALACDEVFISDGGLYMYHQSWAPLWTYGNSKQLTEEVKNICQSLNAIDTSLLAIYEKHSKGPEAYGTIKKNFNSGVDTWLNADETISFFNIQKSEKLNVAYAKSEFLDMENVPKALKTEPEKKSIKNLTTDYMFEF